MSVIAKEQDILFDESVCAPEFPDGCTIPAQEQ